MAQVSVGPSLPVLCLLEKRAVPKKDTLCLQCAGFLNPMPPLVSQKAMHFRAPLIEALPAKYKKE